MANNIINIPLEAFRAFAHSDAADNQAAMMSRGYVVNAKWTASWGSRLVHCTDNAKSAIEENNRVRNALVDSLKAQFGVDTFANLPARVRAALQGSHASTAEGDFGFNAQFKATSGKPLTKRRITAVLNAVEQELGDGARLPRRAEATTPDQIKARQENANEIVDFLIDRFTYSSEKQPEPVLNARYISVARTQLKAFVTDHLAFMGDGALKYGGKPAHTRAALFRKITTQTGAMFGALSMHWIGQQRKVDDNGVLIGGKDFFEAYVRKVFLEAMLAYNARHADSAFYDQLKNENQQ